MPRSPAATNALVAMPVRGCSWSQHDSVRPASHRLPPLHGEVKVSRMSPPNTHTCLPLAHDQHPLMCQVPSLPKPISPQPAPAQPPSRPTSPEPLFQRHTSFRSGGPSTITIDSTKRSEKNLLNQSGGSKVSRKPFRQAGLG